MCLTENAENAFLEYILGILGYAPILKSRRFQNGAYKMYALHVVVLFSTHSFGWHALTLLCL